ncbi:MAG: hypothetical protein IKN17_04150 [Ruminococcus sp.]|nr:hypothetical protein [Ruminococcus sp.]
MLPLLFAVIQPGVPPYIGIIMFTATKAPPNSATQNMCCFHLPAEHRRHQHDLEVDERGGVYALHSAVDPHLMLPADRNRQRAIAMKNSKVEEILAARRTRNALTFSVFGIGSPLSHSIY